MITITVIVVLLVLLTMIVIIIIIQGSPGAFKAHVCLRSSASGSRSGCWSSSLPRTSTTCGGRGSFKKRVDKGILQNSYVDVRYINTEDKSLYIYLHLHMYFFYADRYMYIYIYLYMCMCV